MSATVLSCFSGVGGLDLGLEAAGFDTVGCLEIDPLARDALRANRSGWVLLDPANVVAAGVKLKPADLELERGELTMIAGGPPCQPFSKAAQWAAPKRGVTDVLRGTAVGGMLDLVESLLPAVVLMENVAGFLSGSYNATPMIEAAFDRINRLEGTQYTLHAWTVDAADYGVPQHRRRAIVIAMRDPVELPALLPTTHSEFHRTAWDALGPKPHGQVRAATGKYADLLSCIPEGGNYQHLTAQGAGPKHELFGYRTRFWSFLLKLAKDRPSWTLPASPGPSTGPFHWDNRPLTSAERMLLQGFPEAWQLAGTERDGVRLAGNATPPPLSEALGRFICEILAGNEAPDGSDISPTLATRVRKPGPPPAASPAPLPSRWQERVQAHRPHPGVGLGPAGHEAVDSGTPV